MALASDDWVCDCFFGVRLFGFGTHQSEEKQIYEQYFVDRSPPALLAERALHFNKKKLVDENVEFSVMIVFIEYKYGVLEYRTCRGTRC